MISLLIMERFQKVQETWSWIPAFRAVAETEHLHRAASMLRISPSALSRAVRLLEVNLGTKLFRKSGRNIELTDAGHELLGAARHAMRTLHEAQSRFDAAARAFPLRIATEGRLAAAFVADGLARLRNQYPELSVEVSATSPTLARDLLSGRLDIAVSTQPFAHTELRTERIGSATNGVYAAKTHPLARKRGTIRMHDFKNALFAAPPSGEFSVDRWPGHEPRRVVLKTSLIDVGIASVREGLLIVLPDFLARQALDAKSTTRLRYAALPDTELFVSVRRPIGQTNASHALAKLLVERGHLLSNSDQTLRAPTGRRARPSHLRTRQEAEPARAPPRKRAPRRGALVPRAPTHG